VPLIEVKNLKTSFYTEDGVVVAVDGVDFVIEHRKTLGVVGESGCGKSVTALTIMGLVQTPPGRIESGEILFYRGEEIIDLVSLDPKGPEMRAIRGKEIAMIFQEPMTSLNPVYTIGNQIMEAIMLHQHLRKAQAKEAAIEVLRAVGISSPEQRVKEYPHQLSGGMRQRAMIAMALSCNPSLLIADERSRTVSNELPANVANREHNPAAQLSVDRVANSPSLDLIGRDAALLDEPSRRRNPRVERLELNARRKNEPRARCRENHFDAHRKRRRIAENPGDFEKLARFSPVDMVKPLDKPDRVALLAAAEAPPKPVLALVGMAGLLFTVGTVASRGRLTAG